STRAEETYSANLLSYVSFNSLRSTLPELVAGRLSMNSASRGYLYAAIFSLAHAMISLSETFSSYSGFKTMNALTFSPLTSSGTPTAATCEIASCSLSKDSTSSGNTLNPDDLIISLTRPLKYTYPSSSIIPISPVNTQPSRNVSFVASGRFKYPLNTPGFLTTISPCSPTGKSSPVSKSTIRNSVS